MHAVTNLAVFSNFGWQELLVIALVVVFVSHIIRKRRHKQRQPAATAAVRMLVIMLAILPSICVVGLVLGIVLPRMHQVKTVALQQYGNVQTGQVKSEPIPQDVYESVLASNVSAEQQTPTPQSGSVIIAGSPWTSAVEEHQDFEADIYPSLEAAAEAVGRRLAAQLSEDVTLVRFEPSPESELISTAIQNAVSNGIVQKLPALKVISDPSAASDQQMSDQATVVKLAVRDLQTHTIRLGNQPYEYRSGWLTATIGSTDPAISASAHFKRVFWMNDFNALPHDGRNWMIAYSDGFKTSQNAAHQDAIDAAAQAMETRVRSCLAGMTSGRLSRSSDDLRQRIAEQLTATSPFNDQFTQRFDRPYGTVWREALLVNTQPQLIEDIAQSISSNIHDQVNRQRTTWFSLAALGALIFGMYLFLNAATRGYYAWSLRLMLLLGLVVTGYLVMRLS